MKSLFNKNNLSHELLVNITNNYFLSDNTIYKPNTAMSGIKLSFKDGSSVMLWAYDRGDKYFINFKMFDGIYKIHLTSDQGDLIWMDFMEKFGPHKYSIVEI